MNKTFTCLGIDPGTHITGYGLICVKGPIHTALDFGCIRPGSSLPPPERYRLLFEGIHQLLDTHHPDALSIETQFVYKNPRTALTLGMAKGMALLAASQRKIPIFEYTPTQAKKAIVGTGSASKEQVQKMIQRLLHLPLPPTPQDASDALALALCHIHKQHIIKALSCMNTSKGPSLTSP